MDIFSKQRVDTITHAKSEVGFANNISYSEVEAYGPPCSPLGFPAPHVIRSEIVPVICYDNSKCIWKEGNAIIHREDGDANQPEIAYMLTSLVLKKTICGEIIKGVILRRPHTTLKFDSPIPEYRNGNLWEMTAQYVAVKVDRRKTMEHIHQKTKQRNPENPWKEVAAMQLLGNSHPNVIGLLGAFMDGQYLYEVMRFCPNGTLSLLIRQYPTGVAEHKARDLFLDILSGVQYIHAHGVCHHDISTDNVMLDAEGKCFIIDFGMCLRIPYSYPDDPSGTTDDVTDITFGAHRRLMHCQNHCGKLRFMAPEIYQMEPEFDGYATDVWSLGVVLFVLLTGRQPYERPEEKDAGYHDLIDPHFYWSSEIDPCLSWGHGMSHAAVDLLRHLLHPDPRKRATLRLILNHEWLVESTH